MPRLHANIGTRIAIAAAVPLVVLVGLAGYVLSLKLDTRSQMAHLVRLTDGVAGMSRLVHELQRELAVSAISVGSKGRLMKAELPAQRDRTDEQRRAAAGFFAELGEMAHTDAFKQLLGEADAAVARLPQMRREVDAPDATLAK